jgi:hypothetical protein
LDLHELSSIREEPVYNEPVISDNVTPLPCHLNEFIITEQEILDQLKILNVNKPAGPDGVSPRLLKDIAYSISYYSGY